MAEFFVDPYVKYYNNLQQAESLSSSVSTIGEAIDQIATNVSNLSSQIDSSRWKELGQEAISSSVLPTVSARVASIKSDVTSVLSQVVTKAFELYEKVSELKTTDEKYETAKSELEQLKNSEPSYSSSDGKGESSEHKSWESKVKDKEREVDNLKSKCKNLQSEADGIASSINSLTISDEPAEVAVTTPDDSTVQITELSNGMIAYTFGGETYYIANTKLGLDEYLKVIDKQYLAQKYKKSYKGKCLGFSYLHSYDLYAGYTGHNGDDASNGHSPYSISQLQTWDKDEAIRKIVSEVSSGKPVIVQVNGHKKSGGSYSRHFVTVVGVKQSAIKSGKVSEKDLLIIDSYDGDLRTLDRSKSKNRFMTRGKDTGNGNYGYYVISMKDKTTKNDAKQT